MRINRENGDTVWPDQLRYLDGRRVIVDLVETRDGRRAEVIKRELTPEEPWPPIPKPIETPAPPPKPLPRSTDPNVLATASGPLNEAEAEILLRSLKGCLSRR